MSTQFFALTDDNALVSFRGDNPAETSSTAVTGLEGVLLGIDVRPATGEIYGITTANSIYTIDPDTGMATFESMLNIPFEGGTISGFDFNPVADRLRLVGDNDQDFRINVDTGEVIVDGTLAFSEDDMSAEVNPNITGAAYTNSFAGTTTTQLYDIDTLLNDLVLQDPPNDGTLVTIGDLGINFDTLGGFDILSSAEGMNQAFAVSNSMLYTVDLSTGMATSLGMVGSDPSINFQGLAVMADEMMADRVTLSSVLTGDQEVPESGDADAIGFSSLMLNGSGDALEYSLTVSGLDFGLLLGTEPQTPDTGDDVTRIHLHDNVRGEGGPVAFGLFDLVAPEVGDQDADDLSVVVNADSSVTLSGIWEETDPAVIALSTFVPEIRDAEFGEDIGLYWNVHTEEFPAGAIRGQLQSGDLSGDDEVVGTDAMDSIGGGAGNDTVAGSLGDDLIAGSIGDDVLRGDRNVRDPQAGEMGGNDTLMGGAGNDRLGGKAGNDELYGGEGDDSIWGDAGDDLIRGGEGNDQLFGGTGSDLFILAMGEGSDSILDFEVGMDMIGLTNGLTFEALTLTASGSGTLVELGSEQLAVVAGVEVDTLMEDMFMSV
ncbi:MAG: DUF4394 domain-containing protein [Microcoleaceae cyanobacterium]